jgi:AcrR family transcriptional regulator
MAQAVSYACPVTELEELPEAPLPRYLQLLWDREPAGRRGPKPGRTITEIGAAGVAVADRHGLDGVSMKSVADQLGMTPMSLYRYVDSKEELCLVMMDVAYGPADLALVTRGGWRVRLVRWAHALADALVEHPWILGVVMAAPPLTPNVLSWTDAGVRAFARLPLTDQQKLSALLVVDGYVRSHVRLSVSLGAVGSVTVPDELGLAYATTLPRLIDPARFPALTQAAPAMSDDDGGDFYTDELRFGLDLILDGIEALTHGS